jgi:thiol-disulfide isomerase/thioredoxin
MAIRLLSAIVMAMLTSSSVRTIPDPPRLVEAADIQDLLAHHKGKVVLLNFWATWCPPCLVEFPDIVAIEKAYRDRGLVVISVSEDSPERLEDDLLPYLEKQQPGFSVYVRKRNDPDEFTQAIDPHWTGKIPATFFYDPKGEPSVKRYSQMTRQELVKIVEYLLGE